MGEGDKQSAMETMKGADDKMEWSETVRCPWCGHEHEVGKHRVLCYLQRCQSCGRCGHEHEVGKHRVLCYLQRCQSCGRTFLIEQKVIYKVRKI
jgi:transcription elongation factor Elf1